MAEPVAGTQERAAQRASARRRAVIRRRRAALLAVAGIAAVAGAVVGAGDQGPAPAPVASPAPPRCPAEVVENVRSLAGQRLVVRLAGPPSRELRDRVRRAEVAGVIVFPAASDEAGEVRGWITALRRAAARGGAPVPLAMIDQEGGVVKRLPELPPQLAAPDIRTAAQALAEGERTGRALAAVGVDIDLAPVLDVPASADSFIAGRAFPGSPRRVGTLGGSFARGLASGGVHATAKHFPGLGRAPANTDDLPAAVTATRAELAPDLRPFRRAIAAGVGLVMLSNAVYPALDPRRPASLSPRVVELLREELGFAGVVITDDLGAGAIAGAGTTEPEAAVAAAAAGADLALFALGDGQAAHDALTDALRSKELERTEAVAACARVDALRARP